MTACQRNKKKPRRRSAHALFVLRSWRLFLTFIWAMARHGAADGVVGRGVASKCSPGHKMLVRCRVDGSDGVDRKRLWSHVTLTCEPATAWGSFEFDLVGNTD